MYSSWYVRCWVEFPALGISAVHSSMKLVLGTESTWHLMYLVPLVASLAHMCLTPVLPESPKYLFIQMQNNEAAKKSIRFFILNYNFSLN